MDQQDDTGTQDTPGKPGHAPHPAGWDFGASALALDGWLEFNRVKWKLEPRRLTFTAPNTDLPSIEAVVYLDRRGQVHHPPRNPYLPIRFQSTPTLKRHRRSRQWMEMADLLAAETRRLGLTNTLHLPPEIDDVRAWQWAGFRASVRYTLFTEFPFYLEPADTSVGKIVRRAEMAGYRSVRTTNMADVTACVTETERRQGFQLGLSTADLELAARLLGEEHFRAYACHAPNGEPASVSIVLHLPGAPAIGWVGATRTADLRGGAAQQLESVIIKDLERSGASSYDLGGANIRGIAIAKGTWGSRLRPYYTLEGYSVRKLAKWTLNWWDYVNPRRRQR